jgi:hypothetical protein
MRPFRRSPAGLIAAALVVFFCALGHSEEFYRWTDENGDIHFSDSIGNVPERYRNQIESDRFENDTSPPPKMHQKVRPLETAPADEEATGKKPKRYEVPYTPYEGSSKRVIVSVVFNKKVTAPMAIDTGAPETLISTSLAERLGLFDADQGRLIIGVGGVGGTAPAIRSIIDTLQVGGAKGDFIPTTITAPISKSFDGLLGLDFVSNYAVTIDSRRKVVVFEELPSDPNHPGGHDREWWNALFKEFTASRAKWGAFSEALDKEIRDSMISVGNEDKEWKAFADFQYREAGKLLDKLDRYARENAVPMSWRQ